MRLPRYRCALTLAILAGAVLLPSPASAQGKFRAGLKTAIGDVAELIQQDVEQNRPRREIRALDRALHELVLAFAGGGHHDHGHHGHGHQAASESFGEHRSSHNSFAGGARHLSQLGQHHDKTKGVSSVGGSNALNDHTGKHSAGSPTAQDSAGFKSSQGVETGAAGQSRVADGARRLARPADQMDAVDTKGQKAANRTKNIGGLAGKQGSNSTNGPMAGRDASNPKGMNNDTPRLNTNGAGNRVGKNGSGIKHQTKSAPAGNSAPATRGQIGPGSLVGNSNTKFNQRAGARSPSATGGGSVGRFANAKSGPGAMAGGIQVNITGSNDVVNINAGNAAAKPAGKNASAATTKNAGNALNSQSNQRGMAKNTGGLKGATQPVGTAKNAQPTRNAKSAPTANTKNGVGNLVGAGTKSNKSATMSAHGKSGSPGQVNAGTGNLNHPKLAQTKNGAGARNSGSMPANNLTASKQGQTSQMNRQTGNVRAGAGTIGQIRTAQGNFVGTMAGARRTNQAAPTTTRRK